MDKLIEKQRELIEQQQKIIQKYEAIIQELNNLFVGKKPIEKYKNK